MRAEPPIVVFRRNWVSSPFMELELSFTGCGKLILKQDSNAMVELKKGEARILSRLETINREFGSQQFLNVRVFVDISLCIATRSEKKHCIFWWSKFDWWLICQRSQKYVDFVPIETVVVTRMFCDKIDPMRGEQSRCAHVDGTYLSFLPNGAEKESNLRHHCVLGCHWKYCFRVLGHGE